MNKQQLQELISQGNLSKALELFHLLAKASGDNDLQNTAILLSARYNNVEKDNRMGVITADNYQRQRNQITHGVLGSMSDLPEVEVDLPESAGTDPADNPEAKDSVNQPKVFISYRHADAKKANKVKQELEAAGIDVWIDAEKLEAGGNIEDFIYNCISVTDYTLSLVSKNSLISGWVGKESEVTMVHSKINAQNKLIPCALDHEFFRDEFIDECLDEVQKEVDKYQQLIDNRRAKHPHASTTDLEQKRDRMRELYNQLPKIVSHLNEHKTVDLSDGAFQSGVDSVIAMILASNTAS